MPRNLPYNRADRIAHQVHHVVSTYIYENVDDPRLTGVQITNATLTKDLSIARIYFYIDGDKSKRDVALKALEEIKGVLRHSVGQELVLKSVPKLEFFIDEGVENAQRVEELLGQIKG